VQKSYKLAQQIIPGKAKARNKLAQFLLLLAKKCGMPTWNYRPNSRVNNWRVI
jgi:hypothetical protein